MLVVCTSPQVPPITYVIVHVPKPAAPGSKVPAAPLVIPIPLQVPPGSAPTKLTGASNTQNGPAAVIVASADAFTNICSVSVPPQAPGILYVTVCKPGPAVAGLNNPVA